MSRDLTKNFICNNSITKKKPLYIPCIYIRGIKLILGVVVFMLCIDRLFFMKLQSKYDDFLDYISSRTSLCQYEFNYLSIYDNKRKNIFHVFFIINTQ